MVGCSDERRHKCKEEPRLHKIKQPQQAQNRHAPPAALIVCSPPPSSPRSVLFCLFPRLSTARSSPAAKMTTEEKPVGQYTPPFPSPCYIGSPCLASCLFFVQDRTTLGSPSCARPMLTLFFPP